MQRYTIYRTPNLPNTYLVLSVGDDPRKLVPFNLLYLSGTPEPTKVGISPSYFPFAPGSRNAIADCVDQYGFCFYRWPGGSWEPNWAMCSRCSRKPTPPRRNPTPRPTPSPPPTPRPRPDPDLFAPGLPASAPAFGPPRARDGKIASRAPQATFAVDS